ncbi:NAD(P)/FAD-dependent oxidoreductase [Nonlabens marinus]|uniref:Nitrite reductase probable [NAD(P)H] subunit n=1 Tax=Nonlabens marinus S1-08 TaxID=1454201 RepID=W8VVB2_9FLAO|nr:FAD-dependent oxidoreductase [Nonlabens marinus]BAO55293.1 nitrite reductase probable [NAD(P)H] subunit [Nonlabens marinus S1-08]
MEHIVILGNGIAGITAARHIRKLSDKRITVISAETDYFFSRTALMYVYMGHMKFENTQPYENWFWEKNRIDLKRGYVKHVYTDSKTLSLETGEQFKYDKLVLATGSIPSKYGWPGENIQGVQGLVSKQDLEMLEINAPNNEVCKRAVLIGGGLIGVELSEMLHTRKIPVTFLVREEGFWRGVLPKADASMISDHIISHGIDLRHGEELEEIIGDENGRVKAIKTKNGETIECNLVGICTGVRPQIGFLAGSGIETDKGILVDRYLQTNIEGVYAIGDCAQQREPVGERKAVEAVWYTSRMMGETLAQTLCGNPMKWIPGPWFNSAKFMDIEYQTYGWVWNEPKEGHEHYHWQDDKNERAITIEYDVASRTFIGINTFGIRMKHDVFDKWLRDGATVDVVISRLNESAFDPEFYKSCFKTIKKDFQEQKTTS